MNNMEVVDAISSARFITQKETESLVRKLKKLVGYSESKAIESQLFLEGRVKSEYHLFKYDIDKIHTAISENKKILFQYGNYDTKKEFNLHHHGDLYKILPYGIVWSNDYYYLIGFNPKYGDFRNYRVDRMRNVKISDEMFKKAPLSIAKYLSNTFNMYPGKIDTVEIQFKNQLINAIIDRFGTEIRIIKKNDETFTIRIEAAISEGLKRWVLTWGKDAIVLKPQSLIQMIREEAQEMNNMYR